MKPGSAMFSCWTLAQAAIQTAGSPIAPEQRAKEMLWWLGVKPDNLAKLLAERLSYVQERLATVAPERDIEIIAVTKGRSIDQIKAAQMNGLRDMGENYAAELAAKAETLARSGPLGHEPEPIRWHFQGRLQSNKIKRLAAIVSVWQTVDNAKTAGILARRVPGASIFVEIRTSQDPNRPGVVPAEAASCVAACLDLGLDVRGLMCVARHGSPKLAEADFNLVRELCDSVGLDELSMGMSEDFELAAKHGATMIRLGKILFDPDYEIFNPDYGNFDPDYEI